jgi:type I restriction enzyme M protein
MAKSKRTNGDTAANIGFEAKLWLAADKLRNNMDAAEYKHVVLGLIFLKYISDSFEEQHAKLIAGKGDYAGANPEDPDEYKAENVFWVPPAARWTYLQNSAKHPRRRSRQNKVLGTTNPSKAGSPARLARRSD